MQADGSSAVVVVKLDLQTALHVCYRETERGIFYQGFHVLTRSLDFITIPVLFFWLGRLRPACYYNQYSVTAPTLCLWEGKIVQHIRNGKNG